MFLMVSVIKGEIGMLLPSIILIVEYLLKGLFIIANFATPVLLFMIYQLLRGKW